MQKGRPKTDKRGFTVTLEEDQLELLDSLRGQYGSGRGEKIRYIVTQWFDERLGSEGKSRFKKKGRL